MLFAICYDVLELPIESADKSDTNDIVVSASDIDTAESTCKTSDGNCAVCARAIITSHRLIEKAYDKL